VTQLDTTPVARTGGTPARLRHTRTSPTKFRPVLKLIVGKDVVDARDVLVLCDRGVANELGKLLDSAVANAEHNDHIPEDELYVERAYADEGPTAKRWRPRARGRGVRIRKRTSHVTIVVARLADDQIAQRRRDAVPGPARRRRPTRAPVEQHDHEHDHDDDHDHDVIDADKPAPRAAKATKSTKKAETAKKSAKKATTTKKASPTKKAAKATKKSTAKRAPKKKDN
jgi:large subunit ribosomal protein L22